MLYIVAECALQRYYKNIFNIGIRIVIPALATKKAALFPGCFIEFHLYPARAHNHILALCAYYSCCYYYHYYHYYEEETSRKQAIMRVIRKHEEKKGGKTKKKNSQIIAWAWPAGRAGEIRICKFHLGSIIAYVVIIFTMRVDLARSGWSGKYYGTCYTASRKPIP